jgi:hypothetical protein
LFNWFISSTIREEFLISENNNPSFSSIALDCLENECFFWVKYLKSTLSSISSSILSKWIAFWFDIFFEIAKFN